MVDRQDIDALLIGALYGELTPADEARLTAHLESHPADRTALADLTRARAAVRESRILERPARAAAGGLGAAAPGGRAPGAPQACDERRSESWFARFVRRSSRIPRWPRPRCSCSSSASPARCTCDNGDQFADKTAAERRSRVARTVPPSPRMLAPAASRRADAKGTACRDRRRDQVARQRRVPGRRSRRRRDDNDRPRQSRHAREPRHRPPARRRACRPAPGDQERSSDAHQSSAARTSATPTRCRWRQTRLPSPAANGEVNGFTPCGPTRSSAKQQRAAAPRYREGAAQDHHPRPPPRRKARRTAAVSDKQSEADRKADDDARVGQALSTRAGDLVQAATELHGSRDDRRRDPKRAPDYYNQTVATNRELKQCRTYIDRRAREGREVEKSRAAEATGSESMPESNH